MKAVQEMTAAELLEEQARRESNRRAGRPLDYVPPEVVAQQEAEQLKRADVLEKAEQNAVRKMAIAVGFRVYWLSQARASKQTPGLPDLWFANAQRAIAGWWETKRQKGGKRSTAQEEFALQCLAARIPYGFGDRFEFARWLETNGFTAPPIPQD